tara:strand:- start:1315 stop:1479 length:165 start_codon:yes stop_codon:yes gene_type:complete
MNSEQNKRKQHLEQQETPSFRTRKIVPTMDQKLQKFRKDLPFDKACRFQELVSQ